VTALLGLGIVGAQAAEQFWRIDGTGATWTGSNWGTSGAGPFTTAWTSGNDAHFTANSAVTFATTTVGNVTVDAGRTVTVTAGGTLTLGGVRTFDVGTGSTLTWASQSWSTAGSNAGAGIIKNGAGILDLGAISNQSQYTGGFTLNAGTVIVSGNASFGIAAMTINSGTIQSSGARAFTPTSLTIGGDFALAGTGNANWDTAATIALGSSTRTITNNTTTGSRQFRGLIAGSSGAGLTFAGNGGAQIYIGNTGNTFTGPISITGGEVVFNGDGALGNTANSITLDGGRLSMASMDTGGNTSALTSATISSSRNIFIGSTAGTAISTIGGTGVTTYDGVIADKPSSTGAWAKQGGGMLKLGGVSTYSGNTSINNGTVQLTTGNNRLPTGTTVSLGQASSTNLGTLDLNGFSQQIAGLNSTAGTNATASNNTVTSATAATLTLGGSGTYSYGDGTNANSGVITGAISLVKSGSGTQTLGDANTYTGTTTISNGTLSVNALGNSSTPQPLGQGTTALGLSGSGTLQYTGGSVSWSRDVTVSTGTGVISNTGGGTLTLGGTLTKDGTTLKLTGGTFNVTGKITGTAANSDLVVDNATVTLDNSNNDYNGPTIVQNSGIVKVAADYLGAIPGSATPGNVVLNNGTLNATDTFTLASNRGIAVGDTSGTGTGTISVDSTKTLTYGGIIADNGGTGSLIKSGGGTLSLAGSNTYTGTTKISGGTLLLGANNTISSSSPVELNGGTLKTGGFSDTMGALTLSADSTLDFTAVSSSQTLSFTDYTRSAGLLTITGWTNNGTDFTTGTNGHILFSTAATFSGAELANIAFSGFGQGAALISFDSSFNELVPIPEPATIFACLTLLGLSIWSDRRSGRRLVQ
jgi:autotransporter-associated beta strand protein